MLSKKWLTLHRGSPVAEIKFKSARICLLFNLAACEVVELMRKRNQTLSSGGTVSAIKASCVKEVDRIEKQFDDSTPNLLFGLVSMNVDLRIECRAAASLELLSKFMLLLHKALANAEAFKKYNQVMNFLLQVKHAKFDLDEARRWVWNSEPEAYMAGGAKTTSGNYLQAGSTVYILSLDLYSVQPALCNDGTVSANNARCDKEVDRNKKQFDDCNIL
ncbi:gamma-tubulin complex component 5 isoform X3 [Tanacetum coccineum]|uniref:Gamma-tubulin complex component 5 isoform X3 n=1 Tax=Tanacetum coccineum TaxID=301880 RepID=A0ABQ5D4M7_9ASTR